MNCFKVVRFLHCGRLNFYRSALSQPSLYSSVEKSRIGYVPNKLVLRFFHDYEINSSVQDNYRNLDKVPKDYEIIYRAPMLNYFKYAHYVSFSTAVILPGLSLFSIAFNGPFIFPIQLGKFPLIRGYFDFTMFYAGLCVIISQIFILIFRFPLRIYSDNNGNYIAVYRYILPWTTINHDFKAGELSKATSFMPWGDNLYKFKKKKAVLFEENFLKPIDLQMMLGQDTHDKTE